MSHNVADIKRRFEDVEQTKSTDLVAFLAKTQNKNVARLEEDVFLCFSLSLSHSRATWLRATWLRASEAILNEKKGREDVRTVRT